MIQEQVLCKILESKDSTIITLNNLTEDYFSDYKAEFNFIVNHLNKYENIPDVTTFLNVFPNFEFFRVDENINFLLTELLKDKNKRFLASKFNEIRECIMKDDTDTAIQILKQASDETVDFASLQAVELISDRSRYEKYLEVMQNHDKYFITTGFKELDDIIGGWSCEDDLVTICARNGKGKTWLLLRCAIGAALQGKIVGIYSGEMSENAIGYRADTLIGNIPNGSLIHGNVSVKNDYKKFLDDLNQIVPGKIYVITPKQLRGSASVSTLRAFIKKYHLEALYVDQHSLMRDDRRARDKVEKANNISEDLKGLQSVERIPIIACAQQNREKLEDGQFDTTQIANSDRIGQDSSYVIFIESKDDILTLHGVKVRQGKSNFKLSYHVDLNTGRFDFIPDEKSQQSGVQITSTEYSEDDVF